MIFFMPERGRSLHMMGKYSGLSTCPQVTANAVLGLRDVNKKEVLGSGFQVASILAFYFYFKP